MFGKTIRILLPVLLTAVLFTSCFSLTVSAEESGGFDIGEFISNIVNDESSSQSGSTEPEQQPTEAPPEPTEEQPAETEPAPVETDPPQTEYSGEADAQDDDNTPSPTQSAQDEYLSMSDSDANSPGINSVKMDKSLSDKTYTTDYTAGIVSWICVGVGLIVIFVMLVSTKISGRRSSSRRI